MIFKGLVLLRWLTLLSFGELVVLLTACVDLMHGTKWRLFPVQEWSRSLPLGGAPSSAVAMAAMCHHQGPRCPGLHILSGAHASSAACLWGVSPWLTTPRWRHLRPRPPPPPPPLPLPPSVHVLAPAVSSATVQLPWPTLTPTPWCTTNANIQRTASPTTSTPNCMWLRTVAHLCQTCLCLSVCLSV